MSQTFLSFEQQTRDTSRLCRRQTGRRKTPPLRPRPTPNEKKKPRSSTRRLAREAAYRRKHPPGHAQCGINWYPAGIGWTHCHKCGQALTYTTDPAAKPQECKGRQ